LLHRLLVRVRERGKGRRRLRRECDWSEHEFPGKGALRPRKMHSAGVKKENKRESDIRETD